MQKHTKNSLSFKKGQALRLVKNSQSKRLPFPRDIFSALERKRKACSFVTIPSHKRSYLMYGPGYTERIGKMTIDWSNLQQKAQQRQQSNLDKRSNRLVDILNAVDQRLVLNANDEVIDAIEILLGINAGSPEDVATKLGFTTPSTDDSDDTALPAAPEKPKPVFNDDGTPAGVSLYEQQAITAGYAHKMDGDGNHIGWQKPPTVNATDVQPTNQADADREVDVKDRKGRVVKRVAIADGVKDVSLEAILKADGTVDYFQKKLRLVQR